MYLNVYYPSRLMYFIYTDRETQLTKSNYSTYSIRPTWYLRGLGSCELTLLSLPIDPAAIVALASSCNTTSLHLICWSCRHNLQRAMQVRSRLPDYAARLLLHSVQSERLAGALHSHMHWGLVDTGPSSGWCATTRVKLCAPKVLT
jgi:hypothetical protein